MNNALIIVEGDKFEISIINNLFEKLGYIVETEKRHGSFNVSTFKLYDKYIFLIPGPKPQVSSVIKEFDSTTEDLKNYFGLTNIDIGLIFIVYDVDDANNTNVINFYKKYNNSQEGLLILSNPCLEVIADDTFNEYSGVPRLYKEIVRNQIKIRKKLKSFSENDLIQYINENIFSLLKLHLNRNIRKYGSKNVLEHIDECQKDILQNIISQNSYYYKKIFTTIYVIIAEIFGITKQIENSDLLNNKLDECMVL